MDGLTNDIYIPKPIKYEYLDHTADVQVHSLIDKLKRIHAWGETMQEAFEQCGVAMFGYMTELDSVEILETHEIEAEGDDIQGLLYHFLDELLYMFSTEPYLVAKKIKITEFDLNIFKLKATAYGEEFMIGKHPQGAEVKAITYSAMQVLDRPKVERPEIFVIIDI